MHAPAVWQVVLGTLVLGLAIPFIFFPDRTLQTLRKKRYQYEVTMGLYMLTPTEKFILNSIFFLIISLITLATVVYLPSHLRYVSKRVFYYLSGHFHYPSYSAVTESVASMNNKLQDSLSNASPEQLYHVSHNMAEGASDMAKGIVAAAAGQLGAAAGDASASIASQDAAHTTGVAVQASAEL